MVSLTANDGAELHYKEYGSKDMQPLILLHGFTGSSEVFKRNVKALSRQNYVLVPDLRGHGDSQKANAGYHVARLALDLKNFLDYFGFEEGAVSAIGASLGSAILWCYCELFTAKIFSHLVFVDQAPLQNYASGWGPEYGNRGCNSPEALASLQQTLRTDPKSAHLGTISTCLGYRYHPQPGDPVECSEEWCKDEEFFLTQALRGDGWWYGKLMADHTSLDWRDAIAQSLGPNCGSETKVLVIASTRSGCFPAAGPMKVVEIVNGGRQHGRASGIIVEWGGHWCYWEQPGLFNALVLDFINDSSKRLS